MSEQPPVFPAKMPKHEGLICYTVVVVSDQEVDGTNTWYYSMYSWDVTVPNEMFKCEITQQQFDFLIGEARRLKAIQAKSNGSGAVHQTPRVPLFQGIHPESGANFEVFITL